jgi:hypothetical protein
VIAFSGKVHSQVAKSFCPVKNFVFFNKCATLNSKKYKDRMFDYPKKQICNE